MNNVFAVNLQNMFLRFNLKGEMSLELSCKCVSPVRSKLDTLKLHDLQVAVFTLFYSRSSFVFS